MQHLAVFEICASNDSDEVNVSFLCGILILQIYCPTKVEFVFQIWMSSSVSLETCGLDEVTNVAHHGTITHLLSGTINITDFISFSQHALILAYHQTLSVHIYA